MRIAQETGDVRKALQVCRATLDYRISENKRIAREEYLLKHGADAELPPLPKLLGQFMQLFNSWCSRNGRNLKDLLQVSVVDMNQVEQKTLRFNPKLQTMENFSVNLRWFLAAMVCEFESAVPQANELTLFAVQKKMREVDLLGLMDKGYSLLPSSIYLF